MPVKNKNLKEWREEIFVNIQEYCLQTGNSKYQIWNEFKVENQISSTNNITLEQFPELLDNLKFYLLNKI